MDEKKDIRELDRKELEMILLENGEKPFRVKQIWQWLWKKGVTSFDSMTDLSKGTREMLSERFRFTSMTVAEEKKGEEGTRKIAWRLHDGHVIESVLIPGRKSYSVCVSCQVGCPLGCAFCATGTMGFKRNLTAGEIFDQVVYARQEAEKEGETLSNIVYMGMGEPLLNYENVMRSISFITDPDGFGMSPYRITLSTSGVVPGIIRLADDGVRFNLAVSLHSAKPGVRSSIMPINKKYPLTELADAIRYFVDKTGTRPTFEYLLLGGVNDSMDDARALAAFCRRFPVKINIIEYNSVEDSGFRHSDDRNRDAFIKHLTGCNMIVNVRRSKGGDIDAACGQLAGKQKKNNV